MLWYLIILATALFAYFFIIKPGQYWKSKYVKQGSSFPLLGDSYKFLLQQEAVTDMIKRLYNKFKNERYFGIYQMGKPTLVLRDPTLIKQITVKDFDHFVDHMQNAPENAEPIWARNLLMLKGDKWRDMRATLSPTFTSSKMRSMFVLMENSAQQYIDFYLNQNKPLLEIELRDSLTRFANDVIANCAFGITVDSLKAPENQFYLNGKEISDFSGFKTIFTFLILIAAPKLGSFLKLSIFRPKVTSFFRKLIKDNIELRENQHIVRPDMINLLMEARKGSLPYEEAQEQREGFATAEESEIGKMSPTKKAELTEIDMAAQVLIFFAGFDTISTMMSFMCHELAVNPDIQEQLRQEVNDTYAENNEKLTYDVLGKMKYMDMVISESLRMHPPAIMTDRACTKPYIIEPQLPHERPVLLTPGDVIWLPIAGIHHDEDMYPNPSKFDPQRFSEENKGNIQPYSYLPFGSGPRNCIGSRFALMEVKTLIFHILRNFEITVIEKTSIPIKLAMNQFNPAIEGGFWVGFKRLENNSI